MKLKPCPYCGRNFSKRFWNKIWATKAKNKKERTYVIWCPPCGFGVELPTKKKAEKHWNDWMKRYRAL